MTRQHHSLISGKSIIYRCIKIWHISQGHAIGRITKRILRVLHRFEFSITWCRLSIKKYWTDSIDDPDCAQRSFLLIFGFVSYVPFFLIFLDLRSQPFRWIDNRTYSSFIEVSIKYCSLSIIRNERLLYINLTNFKELPFWDLAWFYFYVDLFFHNKKYHTAVVSMQLWELHDRFPPSFP